MWVHTVGSQKNRFVSGYRLTFNYLVYGGRIIFVNLRASHVFDYYPVSDPIV
jgi:hypothetical protein